MSAHDTIETTAGEMQEGTVVTSDSGFKGCCLLEGVEGAARGKRLEVASKALVGRSGDCDLQLEDKTVSRKHMRVLCKGRKAMVLSLQDKNPVLVNGRPVKEVELADGDALTLGESVLRVRLSDQASSRAGGAGKSGKPLNKVRLATYLLLLVFGLGLIVVAVLPKGEQKPPEQSVLEQEKQKQQEIKDASIKREVAVHLSNGKKYFAQQDYTQAAGRFARVLELDPDNAEAVDYMQRIDAILHDQEQKELAARKRAMELREVLSPLLSQANVFIGTRNFEEAREVLLEARELAPDNDQVAELLQEVETALKEQRAEQARQEKLQQRLEDKVQRSFEKAQSYEKDGQYYRALKEYQYLLSLNVTGAPIDAAAAAVPNMQDKLRELTAKDYQKGLDLLEEGKTSEALQAWEAVLLVYPDHKDARAQIKRLLPAIAEKGKQLYRDGLVLEDLGQMERAVKMWEEAVEVLTVLGEDEYLVKSRKKLEQYRHVEGLEQE